MREGVSFPRTAAPLLKQCPHRRFKIMMASQPDTVSAARWQEAIAQWKQLAWTAPLAPAEIIGRLAIAAVMTAVVVSMTIAGPEKNAFSNRWFSRSASNFSTGTQGSSAPPPVWPHVIVGGLVEVTMCIFSAAAVVVRRPHNPSPPPPQAIAVLPCPSFSAILSCCHCEFDHPTLFDRVMHHDCLVMICAFTRTLSVQSKARNQPVYHRPAGQEVPGWLVGGTALTAALHCCGVTEYLAIRYKKEIYNITALFFFVVRPCGAELAVPNLPLRTQNTLWCTALLLQAVCYVLHKKSSRQQALGLYSIRVVGRGAYGDRTVEQVRARLALKRIIFGRSDCQTQLGPDRAPPPCTCLHRIALGVPLSVAYSTPAAAGLLESTHWVGVYPDSAAVWGSTATYFPASLWAQFWPTIPSGSSCTGPRRPVTPALPPRLAAPAATTWAQWLC